MVTKDEVGRQNSTLGDWCPGGSIEAVSGSQRLVAKQPTWIYEMIMPDTAVLKKPDPAQMICTLLDAFLGQLLSIGICLIQ